VRPHRSAGYGRSSAGTKNSIILGAGLYLNRGLWWNATEAPTLAGWRLNRDEGSQTVRSPERSRFCPGRPLTLLEKHPRTSLPSACAAVGTNGQPGIAPQRSEPNPASTASRAKARCSSGSSTASRPKSGTSTNGRKGPSTPNRADPPFAQGGMKDRAKAPRLLRARPTRKPGVRRACAPKGHQDPYVPTKSEAVPGPGGHKELAPSHGAPPYPPQTERCCRAPISAHEHFQLVRRPSVEPDLTIAFAAAARREVGSPTSGAALC